MNKYKDKLTSILDKQKFILVKDARGDFLFSIFSLDMKKHSVMTITKADLEMSDEMFKERIIEPINAALEYK